VNQSRKIPLFPISSLDDNAGVAVGGEAEDISSTSGSSMPRRVSSAHPGQGGIRADDKGHGRSTSLGTFVGSLGRRQESPSSGSRLQSGLETPDRGGASSPSLAVTPERSTERETSPVKRAISPDKPLPPPPSVEGANDANKLGIARAPQAVLLSPHIVSPTPTEFLLTTGTGLSDPGVGIFVNLDGDVSRGTLEFERYPEQLVVDGQGLLTASESTIHGDEEDGYILAVMEHDMRLGGGRGIEIQRWDSENEAVRDWIEIAPPSARVEGEPTQSVPVKVGLQDITGYGDISMPEVGDKLRLVRLRIGSSGEGSPASVESSDSRTKVSLERVTKEMELFESRTLPEGEREEPLDKGWEAAKNKQEEEIGRRFGRLHSRIVTWSGNRIWWVVRNPLVIRLDTRLEMARPVEAQGYSDAHLDRSQVIAVLNSIRGQEPRTGTAPLSLSYIRQKAGLLLFTSLIAASYADISITEDDKKATENALLENSIDPRVVLAAIPMLREEVLEGSKGIWVFGGVKEIYERSSLSAHTVSSRTQSGENLDPEILGIVKRYLTAWRRKKGYGSVAEQKEAFRTVDAALLRVLLVLDRHSRPASPVRSEIYDLVDRGVDCFDRAVALLEGFGRLYALSRLYHGRKMPRDVLRTWRRILENEGGDGGEFVDGETEVRKYLVRIKDVTLVREYGAWLAKRNPKLGVQVFADDKSRVKLEPAEVVKTLKQEAPDAVKEYLEYLVFGKNVGSPPQLSPIRR
jgi:vacuolar protein sorting-associated protein 3